MLSTFLNRYIIKLFDFILRVSQFSDVERLAEETGCLPSYIAKGIGMGCFYYARCLHEGHGVRRNEAEAKRYYSKVIRATDRSPTLSRANFNQT